MSPAILHGEVVVLREEERRVQQAPVRAQGDEADVQTLPHPAVGAQEHASSSVGARRGAAGGHRWATRSQAVWQFGRN